MKKAAVVTGASSGIGLEISRHLCDSGYDVFGIGRDFKDADELCKYDNFNKVVCDVLDTQRLCECIKKINSQNDIFVLINNAGVGYFGLHEELNTSKIQKMVRTNLEVPMVITQLLLRTLKKNSGHIINISSITAEESNPHGCAYGATKAGLSSFSKSLFDEARKYGVKVSVIQPDMTKSQFYRNADFKEGQEEDTYLLPQEVAQAVDYILSCRQDMAVPKITLQPQRHKISRK